VRFTVTEALVPAVSGEDPAWSVAVTVAVPLVASVTAKAFVPDTRAALAGSVAELSLEVMRTVGVAELTTFQFASTALTVALKDVVAVCAAGVAAVLPVAVPGAATSPGSSTWSLVAAPALIVNEAEVPVSVLLVFVAVTVWEEPARISVIECEASTPAVKADVVPLPAEKSDVEVTSVVPVKFSTVRLPASWAVIFKLNEVPAVCVPTAAPPVVVTAKWSSAP
jgi:hypothetical protein